MTADANSTLKIAYSLYWLLAAKVLMGPEEIQYSGYKFGIIWTTKIYLFPVSFLVFEIGSILSFQTYICSYS